MQFLTSLLWVENDALAYQQSPLWTKVQMKKCAYGLTLAVYDCGKIPNDIGKYLAGSLHWFWGLGACEATLGKEIKRSR